MLLETKSKSIIGLDLFRWRKEKNQKKIAKKAAQEKSTLFTTTTVVKKPSKKRIELFCEALGTFY